MKIQYFSSTRLLTAMMSLLLLMLAGIRPAGQTPISYGNDLSASISVNGEIDVYSFSGNSGDRIVIQMMGPGSPFGPRITLKDPSNAVIAQSFTAAPLARIGVLELQTSGTFPLEASENGNNASGNYGLSLEKVNPAPGAVLPDCTGDLSGDLGHLAEMDAYTFQVATGDKLLIRMGGELSFFDPQIELYSPAGQLLYADSTSGNTAARINAFTALAAGTYTLLAMENEGDNTDNYGLSIQILKATCSSAVTCSQDLSASMSQLAQIDAYTLQILEASRVVIRMNGESTSFDPLLELYGTNGLLIQAHNTDGNAPARIHSSTVLQPGVYTILAMENEGNFLGAYGLSIQVLNSGCTLPISCDGDLAGSLDHLSQMDAYSIEVAADERLVVRMIGELSFFDPQIELYDPNGLLVYADSTGGNAAARINAFGALQAGVYTLLAMENEGDNINDYGISVQVLQPSCALALDCGQDLAGALDLFGEMDAYSFDVPEGGRFILRMIAESNQLDPRMELYDPDGQLVFSSNTGGDVPARIDALAGLPAGVYTLLAMENEGNYQDSYGISVQVLEEGCPPALSCSSAATGAIGEPAAMEAFSFSATDGDQLLFWLDWSGFSFDLRVELFQPDGTVTAYTLDSGPEKLGAIPIEQSGLHTVVLMDEQGSHTGDFALALQLIRPDCSQQLDCGADVQATFSQALEIDAFSMEVPEGASYLFQYKGDGNVGDVTLELYRPGDSEPFQTLDSGNGGLARIGPLTADETGTHYLLVYARESGPDAEYGISGQVLQENCAIPLNCISARTDSVSTLGGMAAYFFELLSPERVLIQVKPELADFSTELELLREDGTLEPVQIAGNDLLRLSGEDDVLPAGRYYLILRDQEGAQSSGFGISLQSLDGACTETLACNAGQESELLHRGEMKLYAFAAEDGEEILIDVREETGAEELKLELYDPQFELVEIESGIFPQVSYFTAGSGQYSLILTSISGELPDGPLGLSLIRVFEATCSDLLQYNETGVFPFDHHGEMHAWRFDGELGEKVLLRSTNCGAATDVVLEIYDPNANFILQELLPETEPLELELPGTGPFTLIARTELIELGNETGMSVVKINPGENAVVLQSGVAQNGSLSLPGEMIGYTFTATQGSTLSAQMTSAGSDVAPRFALYDPDGTLVDQDSDPETASIADISLPESGTYTLVCMDQTGCEPGDFEVLIDLVIGTRDFPAPDLNWSLSPNPVQGLLTIQLELPEASPVRITLLDAAGQPAMVWEEDLAAGEHNLGKDLSGVSAGVYLLKVEMGWGVVWGMVVKTE
ncbi:MAG: T9SS type A sorting domain-containing protein [Saprospirales bacterium]|nr:T9SS type A sorting domain-containing protein [Saprospirales bacterium]